MPRGKTLAWLSALLLIFAFLLAMAFGGSGIDGIDAVFALLGRHGDPLASAIIWEIRLPRVIAAAGTGSLLAAAGVLSQGLFRNALADPSILGTTSGAAAFAALGFVLGIANLAWWTLPLLAFSGAFLSSILILFLARMKGPTDELLLAGFALSAIFSAISALMISLALSSFDKSQALMPWLLGSFNSKSWQHVLSLLPFLILGLGLALSLAQKLDVLSLGHDIALTLGVNAKALRFKVVVAVALLVGSAVAVGGSIGFVGLMVPPY